MKIKKLLFYVLGSILYLCAVFAAYVYDNGPSVINTEITKTV